ncbi:hypothetical protein C9994_14920 [Marivirga lumbricoides]|uniref:Uncharacterized protein n=1 Tax=Marivirga lumbricoides TaxID=1046115 RepID=A0A2T4DDH8_9BACT|nr:hypothetical protein C9994_14920 [Marivirga lumbricoides]
MDRPFEGDPEQWIKKTFYGNGELPSDPKVMTLEYNPAVNGVEVHTSTVGTDGFAAWDDDNKHHFQKSAGLWEDKYYPVDVRSSKAYEEKFGDYYDDDFVGYAIGGSATVGGGGDFYLISGRLKGWGFVQYVSKGVTKGFDIGGDVIEYNGTYTGKDKLNPYSLTGEGSAWSIGLGATYGKWKGYSGSGEKRKQTWKGHTFGVTAGPYSVSGTSVESETSLEFPIKK